VLTHPVSAHPKESDRTFQELPHGHWAYNAIVRLRDYGAPIPRYVCAYSHYVMPEDGMTRYEFAVLTDRMQKSTPPLTTPRRKISKAVAYLHKPKVRRLVARLAHEFRPEIEELNRPTVHKTK
jgi:hypothetical protein